MARLTRQRRRGAGAPWSVDIAMFRCSSGRLAGWSETRRSRTRQRHRCCGMVLHGAVLDSPTRDKKTGAGHAEGSDLLSRFVGGAGAPCRLRMLPTVCGPQKGRCLPKRVSSPTRSLALCGFCRGSPILDWGQTTLNAIEVHLLQCKGARTDR